MQALSDNFWVCMVPVLEAIRSGNAKDTRSNQFQLTHTLSPSTAAPTAVQLRPTQAFHGYCRWLVTIPLLHSLNVTPTLSK